MIGNSQQALLSLLGAALFQKEPILSEQTDWEEVYKEAVAQSVVGLAAPFVPKNEAPRWNEAALQCRAHYMRVVYEQKKLIGLFESRSIPLVILKGTAAAMYYPVPFHRTMGDIDFLVPEAYFEAGNALMKENGYLPEESDDERHTEYSKGGVLFELHRRFSTQNDTVEQYIYSGFDRRVQAEVSSMRFPVLPAMENGLVLLEHVCHHLVSYGLGLRHLCDWCMFVDRELSDEAWEQSFRPMAESAGLAVLAATLTKICQTHLGLSRELRICQMADNKTADLLLDRFFNDGNFGRKNAEIGVAQAVTLDIREKKLFPLLQEYGERNWKNASKHPFLRRFAWLYQLLRYAVKWVRALFSGDNVIKGMSDANRRYDLFEKLGIK